MCPARISSAPASTSPASTAFRCATGFLRERHGAPISWWWRTTTRSAPVRRLPRGASARASSWLLADPARLVTPGPRRVQPDDLERLRLEERLGRLPDALELGERAGKAAAGPGDVVVAGNGEEGRPERPQEARGRSPAARRFARCVRSPLATIRSGSMRLHQLRQAELDLGVVAGSEMQIGDVENAGGHDRGRL